MSLPPFDLEFTPSRGPSRNEAARLAREAVAITERGEYTSIGGRRVRIDELVRRAVTSTVEHHPDAELRTREARERERQGSPMHTTVFNGTSLEAGRELARQGKRPLILNFASAKHAGGGFLNGARAQEESLCRQSSLYACLTGRSMYAFHARQHDPIYASFMIYSPDVPVFIDDDGVLLDEPWLASFVTSPAPNARAVLDREPGRRQEVEDALVSRVTRLLDVCVHHGHRDLVLGAWGCGVFGNDPARVARAFHDELTGDFRDAFDEVTFAVLDWSVERRFIRPFVELFHGRLLDRDP